MVLADDAIDDILDLRNLIGRHRFGMAEVEAQTLRRHHRAFLRDMRAEYAAQGFMQKMRRRMVRPRRRAARTIDLHFDDIADLSAPCVSLPKWTTISPSFLSVSVTGNSAPAPENNTPESPT